MIKKTDLLPSNFKVNSAESFKIKSNFTLYRDIADFWQSDKGGIISALDFDAVISGDFDFSELSSFIETLGFRSVFCSKDIADKIHLHGKRQNVYVVCKTDCKREKYDALQDGDTLLSDEIYLSLQKGGFAMPKKEYFMTDFCLRLNRGALTYFALRDVCVSVGLLCDGVCLISGIVSTQKGMGTRALCSVIKKANKNTVFAVCEKNVIPFYTKNGFSVCCEAAYLIK